MRGFDQRPTGKDEQKGWQEGEPGHQTRGDRASQKERVRPVEGFDVAADKAREGDHHDQRAGGGFAQREAVDHLRGGEPAVVAHRALIHIGQHGVGAAEGEQRGFGEEPGHLREGVVPTEAGGEQAHGHDPQHGTHGEHADEARPRKARMGGRRGVVVDERAAIAGAGFAVATACAEVLGRDATTDVPDCRRAEHDGRKRHIERKDGHKRGASDGPQHIVFERA